MLALLLVHKLVGRVRASGFEVGQADALLRARVERPTGATVVRQRRVLPVVDVIKLFWRKSRFLQKLRNL